MNQHLLKRMSITLFMFLGFNFPLFSQDGFTSQILNPDSGIAGLKIIDNLLPLNENEAKAPYFSFVESKVIANKNETIHVSIAAEHEASLLCIQLPQEATIDRSKLSNHLTISQVEGTKWLISSEDEKNIFDIPLYFEKTGDYTITTESGTELHLIIKEKSFDQDGEENSHFGEHHGKELTEYDESEATTEGVKNIAIVTNSIEFVTALNNESVEEISIKNDFTVSSSLGTLNRNITIQGNNHEINFGSNHFTLGAISENTKLIMQNITVIKTGSASTSLFTSSANNSRNWEIKLSDIHVGEGMVSGLINAPNSEVYITGGKNSYKSLNSRTVIISRLLSIENQSMFEVDTQGIVFQNGVDNSELRVNGGSEANWTSTNTVVDLDGNRPILSISGNGSVMNISSSTNSDGAVFIGGSGSSNRDALISLTNNAELNVHSTRTTALLLRSNSGEFIVENQAKLNLITDTASGNNAALRFRNVGNYKFSVRNKSSVNVEKHGGTAPTIRMYGDNNSINISGASTFNVYNAGNGSANNSDNAGIQYQSGNDQLFQLTDEDSQVSIIADFGPAVTMSGTGAILANAETIFIAEGRTSSASRAVFDTGVNTILLEDPKYFDFRNNRPGGGNIYNLPAASTFVAKETRFAGWFNGEDLDGDPNRFWAPLSFSMTGANFSEIVSTSRPEDFNTSNESLGANGFESYSRLSANNSEAIVDELRVPTNADKKIFGHVSIPEGNGYRSAWTNEVTVEVEISKINGDIMILETKTVGMNSDYPGISIYGEGARGGIFQIDLEEHLSAGDEVRVISVTREEQISTEDNIRVEKVKVFPIVPPTPASFHTEIITNTTKRIEGHSENPNVFVTATHNKVEIDTTEVTVDADGNFILEFKHLNLNMGDEIQVFLRDKKGSAENAGVSNPPKTNNLIGNINPESELPFHDLVFKAASILTVGEVGKVSPVDPLKPDVEVNPENPPQLPDDQGLLSIDFVSQFNFGESAIGFGDKKYYALPQRLLTVLEESNNIQERPNYVQISDRRVENEQYGWQLSVTQNEQFINLQNHELKGARLHLINQQLISSQDGGEPELLNKKGVSLSPGEKVDLVSSKERQGIGTWIYRFGDEDSARESVYLEVPKTSEIKATSYQTTFTWELSTLPKNE
ncbi:WxL domain surface cell wall-binding [Enterococcus casseliflavus]|uniref:WxL domain-containing protein n=1 Tax=Enterococcus casseliflavus TaxID=37734 RepID=UPI0008EED4B4|nr:WxL domain-containing protein [Enterococcus casseliflavus]SFE55762.1 WxL domain surface cell wall-binding [Enterococcus casseliflavus]